MDFRDVVRSRRMVRNYEARPVEREKLERIADTGRRAPSAGFSQGLYLVIVTDEETRRSIARAANEDEYAAKGFDRWMSGAPAHLVVCVREDDYHERYSEPDKLQGGSEVPWPIPYWWVDAGAGLMLILLAAVNEGLAAGFFGFHRLGGLNEILGIPSSVVPIGVVTIGYPAVDRPSGSVARGRRPAAEVIRWERW